MSVQNKIIRQVISNGVKVDKLRQNYGKICDP